MNTNTPQNTAVTTQPKATDVLIRTNQKGFVTLL